MRRLAVLGVGAWVCACVGTNPDWDEPVASGTGGTTIAVQATDAGTPTDGSSSARGGETDVASSEDTAASDGATGSTGSTENPTTEGSSDATSSSGGEPPCDDGWARCDGVCEDIDDDPRHCGAACVDCRIEFGPGAECKRGECREGGGGEGKGD
jgi:hypothetical protein